MLVLHVHEGSRELDAGARRYSRRIDGAVCLFHPNASATGPAARPVLLASPDGSRERVTIHDAAQRVLGTLRPGESLVAHGLSLTLDVEDERSGVTDRIVWAPPARRLSLRVGARVVDLGRAGAVLGSDPGCDVVLDDASVSGRHAQVTLRDGQWLIADLGSTNGLWIGGARVSAAQLAPGVAVCLGRARVECVADDVDATRSEIVGCARAMEAVREAIARYAASPYPVMIQGESGVGKELVARELHQRSAVSGGPLVTVNCAAIAPDVIESELFGHERGAFTGAHTRRRGYFEEAHKGTLFLDEIGELPLSLQSKLLRVLETGEVRRVGGEGAVPVEVRVLSATLRDLPRMVREGSFREDLYFRLSVLSVHVPPLRDRMADLGLLVDTLLARVARETGRARRIEDRALARLMEHAWPGNVRELLSVLRRAAYLAEGPFIAAHHLVFDAPAPRASATPARWRRGVKEPGRRQKPEWPEQVPRGDLLALYDHCEGNYTQMSRASGLARSTLRARMARLGVPLRAAIDQEEIRTNTAGP